MYLDRHGLLEKDSSFKFSGVAPVVVICGNKYRVVKQPGTSFSMGEVGLTDEGKELSALFPRANHERLLEFAEKRAEN